MINWKVRFKNPVFIAQLILSILMPILTYMGLTLQDMTSWGELFNAVRFAMGNPCVLGTIMASVWGTLNDPTTAGLGDSARALTYSSPKKD